MAFFVFFYEGISVGAKIRIIEIALLCFRFIPAPTVTPKKNPHL
jgi:hypothetical protein